jgi:hypothetical protein
MTGGRDHSWLIATQLFSNFWIPLFFLVDIGNVGWQMTQISSHGCPFWSKKVGLYDEKTM